MNSYYDGFSRVRQQAIRASTDGARPIDRYLAPRRTKLRHRMGTGLIVLGRYLLKDRDQGFEQAA